MRVLGCCLGIGLAVVGTVFAVEPSNRLGSTVFEWNKFVVKKTASGDRREVVDQPTATLEKLECHVSTVNPGQAVHAAHRHPQEEFMLVKDGVLDVTVNGSTQRVGPGSLLFAASNDLHGVKNSGDQPVTYFVFNVTTAATHSAPKNPTMHSLVFDWDKLPVVANKTGGRRELMNSPTVTCANFEVHATTLNAGESPHPPHHHGEEEIIVVKTGELEVTLNGVSQRAGPGSVLFFASGEQHGLKNIGSTSAIYHVIRFTTAATPKN